MSSIPLEKLDQLVSRWETVQAELATGPGQEIHVRLAREFAELNPKVAVVRDLREAEKGRKDLIELISDSASDEDMRQLARDELAAIETGIADLEQRMRVLLLPKDAVDEKNVILEVRAGTGGDEAALFAGNLFRMYQRFADLKGWKVQIFSASEAAMGGYKEIIATISGRGAYSFLKYESGVHRVQRVPETESGGRIHTSAATVAVLPEAEDIDVQIDEKDLRIDVFRASGPGGQSVNTTDSAVRITHIPSGIVVSQQDEKSQHKNKAKALKVLRTRLFEQERQKQQEERAADRRDQVGSGDRSQRIRTYNFPQGRVTDHRISLTLHKLQEILAGDGLEEVINALQTENQARQLAAIDDQPSV